MSGILQGEKRVVAINHHFAKWNVLSGNDDREILRDPRSSSNVTTYPGLGRSIDAAFILFCSSVANVSGVYVLLAKMTRFRTC